MNPGPDGPDWRRIAASLSFPTQAFIDGGPVPPSGDERMASINPATLKPLCELPAGSAADVDRAVSAARRAYRDGRWSLLSPLARKSILLRVAELIEEHGDELALLDTLEMGKPISNARAEIAFAAGFFRFYAESTDKIVGDLLPSDSRTTSFSRWEPRGVVGAIVPWNFPLINASLKAAPVLAAGNSLVLKPSEIASLSALRLAELACEAGVPPGVFNVVPGTGERAGAPLAGHGDVDFLTFTGSTRTGRQIMRLAAESNGKPIHLECGGKSPQIISADMADVLPDVAAQAAHEAFWNQGQWCAARSRLLVEAEIRGEFLEALTEAASRMIPGDPLDPACKFGTIASQAQFDRVRGYVDDAIAAGIAPICGPSFGSPCELSVGPVIFADVPPEAAVSCEEVFGPVLVVSSFDDFNEAIAGANSSEYGLAATVWTRDQRRAQRAARELNAGKITIRANPGAGEMSGFALPGEPWGASGFGIEGGLEGLRSYSRLKSVEMFC